MMRFGVTLACLGIPMHGAAAPVSVNATAGGAFAGESVNVALLEVRRDVTAHFALAAAAGYLDVGGSRDEAQLRLMAIGTWNVSSRAIDNCHLISLGTESVERYRIRGRVARPGLFGLSSLSARAFDEVFIDLDGAGFIRTTSRWARGSSSTAPSSPSSIAFGKGIGVGRMIGTCSG